MPDPTARKRFRWNAGRRSTSPTRTRRRPVLPRLRPRRAPPDRLPRACVGPVAHRFDPASGRAPSTRGGEPGALARAPARRGSRDLVVPRRGLRSDRLGSGCALRRRARPRPLARRARWRIGWPGPLGRSRAAGGIHRLDYLASRGQRCRRKPGRARTGRSCTSASSCWWPLVPGDPRAPLCCSGRTPWRSAWPRSSRSGARRRRRRRGLVHGRAARDSDRVRQRDVRALRRRCPARALSSPPDARCPGCCAASCCRRGRPGRAGAPDAESRIPIAVPVIARPVLRRCARPRANRADPRARGTSWSSRSFLACSTYTRSPGGRRRRGRLRDARAAIVRTAIVLLLLGTVAASSTGGSDLRAPVVRRLSRGRGRRRRRGAGAVLVGLLTVAHPVARAEAAWDNFRNEDYVTEPGTPHLTSGFGQRPVPALARRPRPVQGSSDRRRRWRQLRVAYLRERADQSQPRLSPQRHSANARPDGHGRTPLLSSLSSSPPAGLSGHACAAAPLSRAGSRRIAALVFALLARRTARSTGSGRSLCSARRHSRFLAARDPHRRPPGPGRLVLLPLALRCRLPCASLAVALVAGASLAFPWLSAREVDAAAESWRTRSGRRLRPPRSCARVQSPQRRAGRDCGVIASPGR